MADDYNFMVGYANELQLWMPNGDQGNNNLPTLQQYIDNAVRQDGALPASIADYKSYNKVLSQLTMMMVGVAQFMNANHINVFDDMGPEGISEGLQKAVNEAIVKILNSTNSATIKRSVSYSQYETVLTTDTGTDFPIQVVEHDVNGMNMLVYVNGLLYRFGRKEEPEDTKCWYDYMGAGTGTRFIKFRCFLPRGTSIVSVRFGDMNFGINDNQ